MAAIASQPLMPPADPAVLLVLLPVASRDCQACHAATTVSLSALQARLGSAIRVLKIDEVSHPAVVRSFDAVELPMCVLVRRGVELWRQQGLPDDAAAVTEVLLGKVTTTRRTVPAA